MAKHNAGTNWYSTPEELRGSIQTKVRQKPVGRVALVAESVRRGLDLGATVDALALESLALARGVTVEALMEALAPEALALRPEAGEGKPGAGKATAAKAPAKPSRARSPRRSEG